MSKEIKMSDVWSHINFTYGKFQQTIDEFGEITTDYDVECLCGLVFTNEEPAKATMHAIINHDRLTEENKRLREFLESLQLDVSNEIKLEQLLSELGGE